MTVEPDGIALVRMGFGSQGEPILLDCSFHSAPDPQTRLQVLKTLARTHKLGKCACVTLLPAAAYKLLVTEPPNVPPEEMVEAMRWRIKDLIDFPVQGAALDVIEIPPAKLSGASSSIYVVVARGETVRERMELFSQAGIQLKVIDIVELGLRNIAVRLPEDAQGVALIWLHGGSGLLTITRGGVLYLMRNLSSATTALAATESGDAEVLGPLILELQRSFDYYEHQYREGAVRHIALVTAPFPAEPIATALRQALATDVRVLDAAAIVGTQTTLPEDWSTHFLPALGAALRGGVTA